MKITLLNGSPRLNNATTKKLFELIKSNVEIEKKQELIWSEACYLNYSIDENTDVLIIGTPLYFDGISGVLIAFLENLINDKNENGKYQKAIKVYGLCNCGFIEGSQNRTGLMQIEQFAQEAGFVWCGGLGLGGGGMIPEVLNAPDKASIKKPILKAINDFAKSILSEEKYESNIFTQPDCSWMEYKRNAELGWKETCQKNGLKISDLDAMPLAQ